MNKSCPYGWRIVQGGGCGDDGFLAKSNSGAMTMVASWGEGWEHVSVSLRTRCPTWEEMEHIARHFWPDEAAIQYHVPASDHVNFHPFCLHWWRPIGIELPRPPARFVAFPNPTPN